MAIIKPLGAIERNLGKSDIVALAEANAQEVIESGKFDLLKVLTELKRYELYLATIIDKTKEAALQIALDAGEKNLEVDNAKITIMKRTVYDFSGDTRWQSIKDEIDFLTEQRKRREELLKGLAPGEVREIVDEQTGEVDALAAPPAETKLGLMFRL